MVTKKTQVFTAKVTGTATTSVKWAVLGIAGGNSTVGTISSSGVYTAPASVPTSAIIITAVETSNAAVSAKATVVVKLDPAVSEAHDQWLAGVAQEAAHYGCAPKLIEQLPTESVADAVKLFALTASKGTCLVLQPVSTNPTPNRYSFASGGTADGIEIFYLSDVGRVRIWNGAAVSGN